jgi:hypothetical protein
LDESSTWVAVAPLERVLDRVKGTLVETSLAALVVLVVDKAVLPLVDAVADPLIVELALTEEELALSLKVSELLVVLAEVRDLIEDEV